MGYSADNNRNWNEFRWEKEIRQDEKRIRHYFRILPSCLDLPDEEDSIISKLMAYPDLVPSSANPDNAESYLDIFFEGDEEHLDISELKNCRDSDIFLNLHQLVLEWNIVLVRDLRHSLRRSGLAAACIFGLLLARSIDIIELEDAQMPQLRISLLKRILSGINELLGRLNAFSCRQHTLRPRLEMICHRLHNIREKVINILHETRAK
ncbi:MAG: hypothetical protein PHH77_12425 [Victivallaceae bacterium]|nr:hypothetical protein [Victivallaceae bacterium]